MESGKLKEMSETERFKAKYGAHEAPRQSAFLRKRLQGGNKYFDSGDYNVAKSNKRKDPTMVIGKAIPTVDKLPQRKPSSSKLSNLLEGDNPPEKTNNSTEEEVKDEKSELPDEKNAKLDLADGK